MTEKNMTRDDVMRQTIDHTLRVGTLMLECTEKLNRRAVVHDRSKFDAEEFESFAQETPNLKKLTYGSEEYGAALQRIQPAIKRHYSGNSHHPEYYKDGIKEMDLLDILEMLCDWKAATERHEDGNLGKSIEMNAERFGYGEEIKNLLRLTAERMGWIQFIFKTEPP